MFALFALAVSSVLIPDAGVAAPAVAVAAGLQVILIVMSGDTPRVGFPKSAPHVLPRAGLWTVTSPLMFTKRGGVLWLCVLKPRAIYHQRISLDLEITWCGVDSPIPDATKPIALPVVVDCAAAEDYPTDMQR